MSSAIDYAKTQNSDESRRIAKSVQKLLDHVELECLRINRMDQVKRDADRAESIQSEAIKLNKTTEETGKRLDERVNGFHEQSITILGIFSAVVIGFMSGLSMFTAGFNQLSEVNVYIITFYSVIVGTILFDILFMLIFFIAKISGHSVACQEFERKMTAIKKKIESGQEMNYSEWCAINSYKGWLKYCDSSRLSEKYIEPIQPYADRYYKDHIKKGGKKHERVRKSTQYKAA